MQIFTSLPQLAALRYSWRHPKFVTTEDRSMAQFSPLPGAVAPAIQRTNRFILYKRFLQPGRRSWKLRFFVGLSELSGLGAMLYIPNLSDQSAQRALSPRHARCYTARALFSSSVIDLQSRMARLPLRMSVFASLAARLHCHLGARYRSSCCFEASHHASRRSIAPV